MKQALAQMLRNRLETLGVSVSASDLSTAASMLEWLGPAAARIGLTQFEDSLNFTREIAMPALDLLPHIPPNTARLTEIGPGSGGAGLTIASLCPDMAVHMIDRRSRVCAFINVAAAKFDLNNITTSNRDLHELALEAPEFDVVTARAVASPEDLGRSIAKIAAPEGFVALYHTASKAIEIAEANLLKEIPTNLSNLKIFLYQRAAANGDEAEA